MMEPSSSSSSGQPKRKRNQVVSHDGSEVDGDNVPSGSVISGEKFTDYKNKQPMGNGNTNWQEQVKETFSDGFVSSSRSLESGDQVDASKNSELGGVDYAHSDEYENYDYDEDDYEDFDYDTELIDDDSNDGLAAIFDDLNLPTGVEATVPWLQKPVPEIAKKKPKADNEVEIDIKCNTFKQFDTVVDHSDHYYSNPQNLKEYALKKTSSATNVKTSSATNPAKDWAKRIQHEWKVLEKDLPEAIYVRIYENRMDILRAAIEGPSGTPYHNGLFFFDVFFPSNYPDSPPHVHYRSGGLRLNPNLYACGKVCLSLLGTWSGRGCEKWDPSNSTMLQVLVSIQALILNEKPYFNEPAFSRSANTPHGEKQSLEYNENVFLLSCKTVLYSLRRPPKHFEDLVAGHFRKHGNTILKACGAYMAGAQIGCDVEAFKKSEEADSSHLSAFKTQLKVLYEDLLMEFTVKGADCDEFLAQKIKGGAVAEQRKMRQGLEI